MASQLINPDFLNLLLLINGVPVFAELTSPKTFLVNFKTNFQLN